MQKMRKAAGRASVLMVGRVFFGFWRVAAGGQAEPGWGKNVFY